ncbi:MAG: helix-turn-helix type 11 domain protein [Verrucomicrobiales bacterium]|nr:helix-turn-helix type 11 domain protein [Verrucomicrobiales bacterium]
MAHQRPLIGKINPRMNKIMAILRTRGPHTGNSIGRKLQLTADIIRRTIHRLQSEQGISIVYDQVHNTYRLTEKVSDHEMLLSLQFTEREARVAWLGAKALLTCPESGLGQTALKVYEKISALLPEADQNQDSIITFGYTSKPIYRKGILKQMLDLKERRQRAKMYYETDPRGPEWRDVDMLACVVVNEMYYVIAYCHTRKKRLTFCATRIWALEETSITYEIPKTFNLEKYLRGNFGIVGGGKKIYKIVVRFDGRPYLVTERKWKGQKKQVILSNGSVELHVHLRSLWEFERWLKGHPGDFEVLQPFEFRKTVSEAGLRIHRNNPV